MIQTQIIQYSDNSVGEGGGEKMSSSYSPWWKRKIFYKIPFLFKKCSEGNYHWFWERVCFCVKDCDLLDMQTDEKYDNISRRPYIGGPLNDGSILKFFREKAAKK